MKTLLLRLALLAAALALCAAPARAAEPDWPDQLRVGVGPAGGTAAAYFPEFFRVLNVPVSLAYGEWAQLAGEVRERKLDVLAGAAGVPFPSFIELEAKDKVRYLAFSANEIAALRL